MATACAHRKFEIKQGTSWNQAEQLTGGTEKEKEKKTRDDDVVFGSH